MGLLNDLDFGQQEAAKQIDGPLLILAGAGSGKTRVLTYRIAYLIGEVGIPAWNILAVTFTNKAAAEMRERVHKLVGQGSREIWLGTFHSMGARILRRETERLGYDRNFTIYDPEDQLSLIKKVMKRLDISERQFSPKAVRTRIDAAKNRLIAPEEYAHLAEDIFEEKVAAIYTQYQRQLREDNGFDFGDLIMKPVELFRSYPAILDRYQNRFRYVLVDEYQDTNHTQYVLINLLAANHRNLCVVGDDDQSIYGWRGADIGNILDFETDYPETKVIRLEQSYRLTQTILSAANAAVENNLSRKGKRLWTKNPKGDKILLMEAFDEVDEALWVVDKVREEIGYNHRKFGDFVVLYRTNAQSRAIEDRLRWAGIPYVIVGGIRFYERKEVKDILAYLKLLANSKDSVSLRRIINIPRRGIGETTLRKLEGLAAEKGITLFQALERQEEVGDISAATRGELVSFCQLMNKYISLKGSLPADQLARELVAETGYLLELRAEGTLEAENRAENVRELLAAIEQFVKRSDEKSLEAFLEEVSLITDIDRWDHRADAVSLMTLHCAKGLEFPVVFITGLEEGLFPLSRAYESSAELEEERRLFYVGMTRAREKLYLSMALQRHRYSNCFRRSRSRFLDEIPEELLEVESITVFSEDAPFYGKDGEDASKLDVGQWVEHPSFGKGQILQRIGFGDDLRVVVLFENNVKKKLMAKYADLRVC